MKTIKTLFCAIISGLIVNQAFAQQPTTTTTTTHVKAGYGVPVQQTEPEFPGGQIALVTFLHENLKYPVQLRDSKAGGNVVIMFIVNTEGKIVDPVVLKGVNEAINEEALRVVKMMPDWKPATAGGLPVSKQYVLPIDFVPPSI